MRSASPDNHTGRSRFPVSAFTQNKKRQKMTDTNTSGATFAPAADTQAPAASAETPAGNFGSTRGSGLARGKRQVSASAPTENTAKSDYKPLAREFIPPASEYKTPSASPEPENTPAAAPAKVEITAEPAPKAE